MLLEYVYFWKVGNKRNKTTKARTPIGASNQEFVTKGFGEPYPARI